MDNCNVHLWRFYSCFRFLLKSMDYPNSRSYLNRINHAESISSVLEGNFKNATLNTLKGLGLIRFATICGNRKGTKHVSLDNVGKIFKIPSSCFDP